MCIFAKETMDIATFESQKAFAGKKKPSMQRRSVDKILHPELVAKGEPQGVTTPGFVQHLVVTKVGQSDIVT